MYGAQGQPAASQNRRRNQSPTCALIGTVIGGRLLCQIPVRLDRNTLNRLRIAVVPQRWTARRGYQGNRNEGHHTIPAGDPAEHCIH